jgi:hypothetical protein
MSTEEPMPDPKPAGLSREGGSVESADAQWSMQQAKNGLGGIETRIHQPELWGIAHSYTSRARGLVKNCWSSSWTSL